MKNLKSKKGFSLIELIVVIAVIAAIAAIIVPSISNFSDSAKKSADQRNVQLWNATYLNCKAAGLKVGDAGLTITPALPADNKFAPDSSVPKIEGKVKPDGTNEIIFSAEGFKVQGKDTLTFDPLVGLK